MSWDVFWDWFNNNVAWFVPSVLTALAMIGGLIRWIISRRDRRKASPPDDTAAFIAQLIGGLEKANQRVGELESENKQLTKAVGALKEQAGAPDAPPGIDAALKQLAQGATASAEAIFEQVLERKKGEAASKEAAAAARHIGALAYLHDTQKALSAYAQAVDLDPEDSDGWNMLGAVEIRLGHLDAATQEFERVLALGNQVDDKAVVAMAYGNLGVVYETRGDLAKAEECHLKALALNEKLGHKEGMASAYGNLGNVYEARGDLAKAEEYHLKSLAIEKELGRKEGMASDYGNLGSVYLTRGDLEKAEGHFLKALALDEKLGRKEGMANAYSGLGSVYLTRGDLVKACAAWAESVRLFEELGAKDRADKFQRLMDEAGCGREKPGREEEDEEEGEG